jgi:hypothetical protein
MEDFNLKKAKNFLLEGAEFEPTQISQEDLEKVKFMFRKLPLNQDLRDVLGFDQVYQNQISIEDGKIVISVFSKPRK